MKIGLVLKPFPKGKMVLGRKTKFFPEDVFSLGKPLGFRSKNQTSAHGGAGRKLTNWGQAARGRKRTEMGNTPFHLPLPHPAPAPGIISIIGVPSPKRRLSWSPACSTKTNPRGPRLKLLWPGGWLENRRRFGTVSGWYPPPPTRRSWSAELSPQAKTNPCTPRELP